MPEDTKDSMQARVGMIGFGNMGAAIAGQLQREYRFIVYDKETAKLKEHELIEQGIDCTDVVSKSEKVILAVKPQDIATVLKEMSSVTDERLVISIAAGITTTFIEGFLPRARVIRVMPNMAIKIKQGMTCLCRGKRAQEEDLSWAQGVFNRLGHTLIIPEHMMDAATAISGSGPGYFFDLIEHKQELYKRQPDELVSSFILSLTQAAEELGFNQEDARLLASTTAQASSVLLHQSGDSPGRLRDQVASKGGTTEAGLTVLRNGGTLLDAVRAAVRRAAELSKSP
jgi:pyrroline-5-carboxylate reductase